MSYRGNIRVWDDFSGVMRRTIDEAKNTRLGLSERLE